MLNIVDKLKQSSELVKKLSSLHSEFAIHTVFHPTDENLAKFKKIESDLKNAMDVYKEYHCRVKLISELSFN